jgi:hypothetical protein
MEYFRVNVNALLKYVKYTRINTNDKAILKHTATIYNISKTKWILLNYALL